MTYFPSLETISQARDRLAKELSLEPHELEYLGVQEGLRFNLALFNVSKLGPGNGTTRSVRVPL